MVARRDPVLQHERAHTQVVQPFRYLMPLMIDRQKSVATSRADHHGRAVRLLRGCWVEGEGGSVLLLVPDRTRRSLRPEVFDGPDERGGLLLLGHRQAGRGYENEGDRQK